MNTPSPKRDRTKDHALVGTTLAGKYKVLELLGQGGFGSVYLVEIVAGMVGEKLALKLLPTELTGDEKVKAQFINEIRVAMRMVNKYIVQIRDIGETEDGHLYYTMDYCPGETLAGLLKREGKLPPPRAIPIVLRILEALKTAHSAGVVHRDLKPANVMVFAQDGHETVRVLDFGIATAIRAGRREGTGFVGSPHYMPPEQFLNEELGFYTDTYSVGVILYECLTGQKPYPGRTPQEVYNNLKSRPAAPPDQVNPELAAYPGLSALITRSLERNPELRFPSARDLFAELKAVLEGRSAESAAPAAAPAVGASSTPAKVARRRTQLAGRTHRKSNIASGVAIAAGVAGVGTLLVVLLLQNLNQTENADPATKRKEVAASTPASTAIAPPPENGSATQALPPPPQPPPIPPPAALTSSGETAKETKAKAAKVATPADAEAARRDAEERARKKLQEALVEAGAERWDKVREICMDAATLDPASAQAHRLKGQAELKLGMFEEALVSFGRSRTLTPPEKVDAALLVFMIDAYRGRPGSDPQALGGLLAEAMQAMRREPAEKEATVKVLGLLEERGEEEEVMSLIAQARAQKIEDPLVESLHQKYFVDLPRERETKAQEFLKEARQLLKDGDFAQAAGKAQEGYQLKPMAELGLTLAEAHHGSGRHKEALATLTSVGPLVGEDLEGLARMGILYGQSYIADFEGGGGKKPASLDLALENLNAALEVLKDPKLKAPLLACAARTYRARCFALQGSLAKVDEELKLAKAIMDREPELIYHQAESYRLLGDRIKDPDRAAAYQRGIQRLVWYNDFKESKKDPRGYFLMGICYLRLGGNRGNFNDAINQFVTAQRLGMKDDTELLSAWAEAYIGLGDHIRAGQKYRDAFEAKKTEELCVKAVNCFLEANSRISAEKMVREGLAHFPQSTELQKLLARVGR